MNGKRLFASTLFISFAVQAAGPTTISTVITVPPTIDTTTHGDITITSTGAITGTTDGITVDSKATVTINSDNASSVAPNAIEIVGGSAGIFVTGAGTDASISVQSDSNITSSSGSAIYVSSNSASTISNSGSLIGGGPAVWIINSTSALSNTNTGTISSIASPALRLTNDAGSVISNSGTMSSVTGQAILLEGGGTTLSIVNTDTGVLSSTTADVVVVKDGSQLTNGFINSGTITTTLPNNAINFGDTTSSIIFINNDSGTVTGNIIVSSNAVSDTVFEMNGGTINGTVKALIAPVPRIFDITGGSLVGGIDLSASTKPDTINQSGGLIGNILGSTGTFQTLNILNSVTTGGSISNIDNIIVNPTSIFGVTQGITNVLNLTINSAAALINVSDITGLNITVDQDAAFQQNTLGSTMISGVFNNNGTLILPVRSFPNPNVTVATYNQSVTGTLVAPIQDKFSFGQLQVIGTATVAGDLKVTLTGGGFNSTGDLYRIVTTGNPVIGTMNIIQPTSQTLRFTQVVDPNNITLEVTRISLFLPLANSPITAGPAAVLDSFLPNPSNIEIQGLIGALDSLANVNDGLLMLVPPFDGGLIQWSHSAQDAVFKGLGRYLDEHKWITALLPGYVAGDTGMGRPNGFVYSRGSWAQIWGARARQAPEDVNLGYDLETIGVILGYDQYCSDRVVLGGALSYAWGSVHSKGPAHNDQNAKSFQLTAYSTYDYAGPGYLDTIVGVAFNQYITERNILIGPFNQTALSDFEGWQYGVQLETGYRFAYAQYRIIPVAKARYSRLELDNYTETGAGGIGLSVKNEPIEEGITSIGIKLNSTNDYRCVTYVPEFRFNLVYDWIADASFTTSNFILGGPVFTTEGFKPKNCTYNFGASLTILAPEGVECVLDFELDLRKEFVTYLGLLKMRYEW